MTRLFYGRVPVAAQTNEQKQESAGGEERNRAGFGNGCLAQRGADRTGVAISADDIGDEVRSLAAWGNSGELRETGGSQTGCGDVERNRAGERIAAAIAASVAGEGIVQISESVKLKVAGGCV